IGEVEQEKWPADLLGHFSSTSEVHTPATLADLMNHLLGASTFIGNDSGPGHLAGILGGPTVSIFGPKNPVRWKPLGPHVSIVQGEWDEIDVDRVLAVVG
ncbi:MAG TPA: glycosyltransferase family 9 protein, partial [Tepidisphaeraceae bacterium]|nr:glycosyltransferase family 9 protein [Tepidisphaeraceae bacterium]